MTDAAFRQQICSWHSRWLTLASVITVLFLCTACGNGTAVNVAPTDSKDINGTTPKAVAEQDQESATLVPGITEDESIVEQIPAEAGVIPTSPDVMDGWFRISPPGDFYDLVTVPAGNILLGAKLGEGLISHDGGHSWEAIDWPGERRSHATLDPSGQRIIVSGVDGTAESETTVVWSADGGRSWANSGRISTSIAHYAATAFLFHTIGRIVLTSEDGGLTGTTLIDSDLIDPDLNEPLGISVNRRDIEDFFLISRSNNGTVQIARTLDNGFSLNPVAGNFALSGNTEVRYSDIGPMIMSHGVGVLLSFDQGLTWFAQNTGLDSLSTDGAFTGIVDFVVLPTSSIPIVAAERGIYRFDPGGWEFVAGPGGKIRALAIQRGETPQLLAATSNGLWAISTDVIASS